MNRPCADFVGESCAFSRAGETWCPANRDSTVFYKLPIEIPLRTVLATGTPLTYLLAEDGQLYLIGQFDSNIDPKWSLDYSTPQEVPGLDDLVYLTNAGDYYGPRGNGQLVSWELSEKRDEDAMAVRIEQTSPKVAYPSPLKRVTGDWGLCLEDERNAWCTKDKTDLATGYRFQVSGLSCYTAWMPIGLGNQRLKGHFQLNVAAQKVDADAELVLDKYGSLFAARKPPLLSNSPEELKSPDLKHLKHLGEVADFEGSLCIISTSGVLSCDTQGNWSKDEPAPVTFTLTPPPKVKGPGD